MRGKRTFWLFPAVLSVAAVGCASNPKDRIVLLEEANANLTSRLNLANAELDKVREDQLYLDRRLHAAMNEASDLRGQLDAASVPQAAAPGWTAVPGGAMIAIDVDVLFSPGKVTLLDEARRSLDAVVSVIEGAYSDKDVLVLGHTDDQPIKKSGWADNWQLSSERALSVMRFLHDRGVASTRLMSAGCGEHRPRVAGRSASDRAMNRRVEIFALQPLPHGIEP